MRTRNAALAATAALALIAAPSFGASKGYTLTQVKAHAKANNCWAVINGSVYDLTKWVNRHPGGSSVIKALCGTDGSAVFKSVHGMASGPAGVLSAYRIGALVTAQATPAASETPAAKATASASASASAKATASASASAAASASSAASPATASLTPALVATHKTTADCWSIVNNGVYDLTAWISRHPGGATVIKAMCGADGTAAFKRQHGTATAANSTLAGYKIGTLGAAAVTPAPTSTASASSGYTAAQVRAHTSASDCWVVINGSVYDFTTWIPRHQGGQSVIKSACGLDASAAFGSVRDHYRYAQQVQTFRIGSFDASSGTLPKARGEEEDDD